MFPDTSSSALSVRYQKCRKRQTLTSSYQQLLSLPLTPFSQPASYQSHSFPELDFYHGLLVRSPFPSNFLSFPLFVDYMLAQHKMLLLWKYDFHVLRM